MTLIDKNGINKVLGIFLKNVSGSFLLFYNRKIIQIDEIKVQNIYLFLIYKLLCYSFGVSFYIDR